MNRKTRSITQGALTASLSVIIVLLDRLLNGFIMPFLPLPLIIYGQYHTIGETLLAYVVTILLVAIVPGSIPTTILMILYGLIALVYLLINRSNYNKVLKFLLLVMGISIAYIVMILNFGAFFGLNLEVAFMEARAFIQFIFKAENENLVKYVVYLIIFSTIILETIIINLSAKFLIMRIGIHRNNE